MGPAKTAAARKKNARWHVGVALHKGTEEKGESTGTTGSFVKPAARGFEEEGGSREGPGQVNQVYLR